MRKSISRGQIVIGATVVALCGLLGYWTAGPRESGGPSIDTASPSGRPTNNMPSSDRPSPQMATTANRRPPPRIIAPSPVPESIWSNPGAREYDPTRVLLEKKKPIRAIFATEVRDDNWAPAVESSTASQLNDQMKAAVPGAQVEGVECRAATCVAEVSAPSAAADDAYAAVQYLTYGTVCSPERAVRRTADRVIHQLICVISPDHRNIDFEDWMQQKRAVRVGRVGTVEEFVGRIRDERAAELPKP